MKLRNDHCMNLHQQYHIISYSYIIHTYRISDVVMTLDVDDQSICGLNDSSETIQNALQTWIALAYLQVSQQYDINSNASSNINSSKVTTLQQWLEITTISIKNIHIRIEHPYTSHIPLSDSKVS